MRDMEIRKSKRTKDVVMCKRGARRYRPWVMRGGVRSASSSDARLDGLIKIKGKGRWRSTDCSTICMYRGLLFGELGDRSHPAKRTSEKGMMSYRGLYRLFYLCLALSLSHSLTPVVQVHKYIYRCKGLLMGLMHRVKKKHCRRITYYSSVYIYIL